MGIDDSCGGYPDDRSTAFRNSPIAEAMWTFWQGNMLQRHQEQSAPNNAVPESRRLTSDKKGIVPGAMFGNQYTSAHICMDCTSVFNTSLVKQELVKADHSRGRRPLFEN